MRGMSVGERVVLSIALVCASRTLLASEQVLLDRMVHLRSGEEREWDEFPEKSEAKALSLAFTCTPEGTRMRTLELVQEDVKQEWGVWINDARLGRLPLDENTMRVYFPVPEGCLVVGENRLRVECMAGQRPSDDIRIGGMVLHERDRDAILSEAQMTVRVTDRSNGRTLPARLTIVDRGGVLQETSATSNHHQAVRPGVIYTAGGRASWSIPAGDYTVYAGRGFEYSLARRDVSLMAGDRVEFDLTLERQVDTDGWVACDTHVHTLTYSGHGDASIEERLITLAGEGIELPVATDHNVHVDYRPVIRALELAEWLTPVMGNEVTTDVGHFNIFPIEDGAPVADFRVTDWPSLKTAVESTPGVKAVILNHARDIHRGFRPFDAARYDALVGENASGWPIPFNAMEVVNSSAIQSDVRGLFEDWLALINRGYRITPVGSSDAHDVARFIVGQGRTYIRCADTETGAIDVPTAVDCFCGGQVAVSYGLLVTAVVESEYGPGELATVKDGRITIDATVRAPDWIRANSLELFVNGRRVRAETISAADRSSLPVGVAWQGRWEIDVSGQDVSLAVMALGDGIEGAYWPTAKPYQPVSTAFQSQVFGCTGAVWVDVDGNGHWTSAYEYAQQAIAEAAGDGERLLERLSQYDETVSLHAAHALRREALSELASAVRERLAEGAPHVQRAFEREAAAWRTAQRRRVESPLSE